MKSMGNLAVALWLVLLSGCAIPNRTDVFQGQVYSKGALAFLDIKGTTRAEVISTLGTPAWESKNSRVLLYVSETALHWTGFAFVPVLFPQDSNDWLGSKPVSISGDDEHKWRVLLVAYDERGFVTSHMIRKVGNHSLDEKRLEALCVDYSCHNAIP
ncbi:MAG TPA: hypothetical protein VMJ12_14050 [Candidatus Acidoferrales bacterium]|nr:hypothetical protein [Candidatus Acidoferrales bacterium]